MPSTITVQNIINLASTHIELLPMLNVGGYTNEPALSLANETLATLLAQPLDWQCNRTEMNMFVTSANRQDYKFAGATFFSVQQGAGIDLVSNSALTISGATVTIKTLETYNGNVGDVCYILGTGSNYDSTFTQNGSTSTFGGNTYTVTNISGLTVTATLTGTASGTSGAAGINDYGWLTGGSMVSINTNTAILPTRHLNVVRELQPVSFVGYPEDICVLQDLGTGVLRIRFRPVPGSAPWGVSLVYQKKAPLITALTGAGGTWAPFPDEFAYVYRQKFLALAYRYSNSPRADAEEMKADKAIAKALAMDEREVPDVNLYPAEGFQTNDNYWWVQ
jgi:hypothetical protein